MLSTNGRIHLQNGIRRHFIKANYYRSNVKYGLITRIMHRLMWRLGFPNYKSERGVYVSRSTGDNWAIRLSRLVISKRWVLWVTKLYCKLVSLKLSRRVGMSVAIYCSYPLFLILESMDPVGSVDSVGSNLIPLDPRIATDPCHVISVWLSWCGWPPFRDLVSIGVIQSNRIRVRYVSAPLGLYDLARS